MKRNICILFALFLAGVLCMPNESIAKSRKKKKGEEKQVETVKAETPYDKLFKGKRIKTADGLVKVHLVDCKSVYLEIPEQIMGCDLLFYSSIDKSTNSGEGFVGDRSKASFAFRFVKRDKQVDLQLLRDIPVSADKNISAALQVSNLGVALFSYPIKATSGDGACVIDATGLFMDDSPYTNPFPSYSANSMGVFRQVSSYQKSKSCLLDVKGGENYVSIQSEQVYDMAGAFGAAMTAKRLLTMHVSRHIMMLPEKQMDARPADPRLNFRPVLTRIIPNNSYIAEKYRAARWNIEPSDEEAYRAGKTVEPKKPIVFYLDTLIPRNWREAIRRGVQEWNKAFEKIGLQDVLRVENVPLEAGFDINNPYISVIRYVPSSAYNAGLSTTVDPRTGEIVSASMTIPSGIADALQIRYNVVAMIHDPAIRQRVMPVDRFADLIQAAVVDYTGRLLGFEPNSTALHVYSPEELRSSEFTCKHGLYASIVGNSSIFNYIAQPEDVEKGTVLMQKALGNFDYFAVKCLYRPMEGCASFEEKSRLLDQWIGEVAHNPVYQYRQYQFTDVSSRPDYLGNNATKALEYRIKNLKIAFANFIKWYADGDEELGVRSRMYNLLRNATWASFDASDERIGGMVLNDDYAVKNNMPSCVVLPRAEQEEALKVNTRELKELSWMFVKDLDSLHYRDFNEGKTLVSCYARLFERVSNLLYANQLATDSKCVYPLDAYLRGLRSFVFNDAWENSKLVNMAKQIQVDFILKLIATAGMNEFIGAPPKLPGISGLGLVARDSGEVILLQPVLSQNVLEPVAAYYARGKGFPETNYAVAPLFFKELKVVKAWLEQAMVTSNAEVRKHYTYCLFVINKAMNSKNVKSW